MESPFTTLKALTPAPHLNICLLKWCTDKDLFHTNEVKDKKCLLEYTQSNTKKNTLLISDGAGCVLNILKLVCIMDGVLPFSNGKREMRKIESPNDVINTHIKIRCDYILSDVLGVPDLSKYDNVASQIDDIIKLDYPRVKDYIPAIIVYYKENGVYDIHKNGRNNGKYFEHINGFNSYTGKFEWNQNAALQTILLWCIYGKDATAVIICSREGSYYYGIRGDIITYWHKVIWEFDNVKAPVDLILVEKELSAEDKERELINEIQSRLDALTRTILFEDKTCTNKMKNVLCKSVQQQFDILKGIYEE